MTAPLPPQGGPAVLRFWSGREWLALLVASVVLVPVTGCSSPADKWVQTRPPTFAVAGEVLLDGVAVPEALVAFDSVVHDLTAVGHSDADGRFELKTFAPGDGAVAGEHRVRVTRYEVTGYDAEGLPIGEVNRLPARYEKAGGELTATVAADTENFVRLKLTRRPLTGRRPL